jgi:MFS family permease
VFGPALAQRTLFFACAACGGGAVLLGARWLPDDPGAVDERRARRLSTAITRARRLPIRSATFPVGPGRVYWLTRNVDPQALVDRLTPGLAGYFLAVVAVFTGFGVFWGPLPLYLTGQGYAEAVVFALYLVSSLGSAVSFAAAGRLASRHDPAALQTVGLAARGVLHPVVAVIGLVVPASVAATGLTGVVFALIGVAWALVAVTAATLVTRLSPASIRGEALGLYTALSGLASGVGSVLGGYLGARSFPLAFGVAGGLVALGALGTGLLWRRSVTA